MVFRSNTAGAQAARPLSLSGCPMPATTRCLQCRTEVPLTNHKSGRSLTCPRCKIRWVPIESELDPEPGLDLGPEPPPLDQLHPPPLDQLHPPHDLNFNDTDRPHVGGRRKTVRDHHYDEPEQGRRANTAVIVGVTFGMLALAGAGIGVWFALGKKDEPAAVRNDSPKEPDNNNTDRKEPEKEDPLTTSNSGTPSDLEPPKPLTGEQIYPRLLQNTALLSTGDSLGSGVLVHTGERLVITNYHVVREEQALTAMFPAYDPTRNLITSPDYYAKNSGTIGIPATVILRKPGKDLAVLRLKWLPDGVRPAPLATKPAPPGAEVFSVGASGVGRNLLWALASGKVKGRSDQTFDAPWGKVSAAIMETDAGVNHGDSGGPVVNNRGELVGVVAHALTKQRQVSGNIDITEIRAVLLELAQEQGLKLDNPADLGVPLIDPPEDAGKLTDKLIAQLDNQDPRKRRDAAERLAALGPDARRAFPALLSKADDPDTDVRPAVALALKVTGSPTPTDIGCFEKALKTGGPNARLYALRFYSQAKDRAIPEPLLHEVVKLLADTSAEVRRAAILALANYGPGCKPKALEALFGLTLDPNPTVAEEAEKLVTALAPFGEADRPALVKLLAHTKPSLRLKAARLLAPITPDADTAVAWFKPRLTDEDLSVRKEALAAIARWPAAAKACRKELLDRTTDANLEVAMAAVQVVVKVGGPEVAAALTRLILSPTTPAELKEAAIDAVLTRGVTDAKTGVPVLVEMTAARKATVRVAALKGLARFGAEAKGATEAVVARLTDENTDVKVAAIVAIGAIGADAAVIPNLVALLTDKEPEEVAAAAAASLGKLGPKAVDPLARTLTAKLPSTVLVKVCEALGGLGKDAQSVVPSLFDALNRQPALAGLSTMAIAAVQQRQPWVPDPVAAALGKIGGDKTVEQLLDLTQYQARTQGGIQVNKKTKYGERVQFWAICTLGSLEPNALSPDARRKVSERLAYLARWDPDQACKDAAKLGQVLHPPPRK